MGEKSILDTTILIETIDRGRHMDLLSRDNSISIISIYEYIRYKKKTLANKLLLESSFDVIDITNPILLKSAEIFLRLKVNGVTVSENDIYIASAALVNNLKLYTKDRDFIEIRKYFGDLKMQFISD